MFMSTNPFPVSVHETLPVQLRVQGVRGTLVRRLSRLSTRQFARGNKVIHRLRNGD